MAVPSGTPSAYPEPPSRTVTSKILGPTNCLSRVTIKDSNQDSKSKGHLKCIVAGFPKLCDTSYTRQFYLEHGKYIFLVILNISDYTEEKNLNLIFNNYLPPASLSCSPFLPLFLIFSLFSPPGDCRLRTLRWHNTSYFIIFLWLLSIYGE